MSAARQLPPPPPHSRRAEIEVLGGLLVHPEKLDLVADMLAADDFYSLRHRYLFQGMIDLAKIGTFDPSALCEHLRSQGYLEEAGGPKYVSGLLDAVPTAANIETHAGIVVRAARRRDALLASQEIAARLQSPSDDDQADLDWAEQRMFQACRSRDVAKDVRPAGVVAKSVLKDLDRLKSIEGDVTGLSTGRAKLDEMTSGLQPGELAILAARPAMGKTALAVQMAWTAAQGDEAVLLCSIEMAGEQLVRRLISIETGIDGNTIRHPGRLQPGEWEQIRAAGNRINDSRLVIDDSGTLSTWDIRARGRRLKAKKGLCLIVIDYLQIMKAVKEARGSDTRNLIVADMTRELKAIAKYLHVPVLCISQLNRGPESRTDKRPNLGDLRDSGAIEQDADLVMFLYRGNVYYPGNPKVPENGAEVIIGKNRNGPVGTAHLLFHRERTEFEDWDDSKAIYPRGDGKPKGPSRPRWAGSRTEEHWQDRAEQGDRAEPQGDHDEPF